MFRKKVHEIYARLVAARFLLLGINLTVVALAIVDYTLRLVLHVPKDVALYVSILSLAVLGTIAYKRLIPSRFKTLSAEGETPEEQS